MLTKLVEKRYIKESIDSAEIAAANPRPKLLLVDDVQDNLFALQHLLAPLDAELFLADSGDKALSLILKHRFAVVLLDVQMPGMDGFETAALMHTHRETRDTPVIFVTAISKEQRYVKAGYAVGAVDYLFKPLDPDILLSKVRVFMELESHRNSVYSALTRLRRVNRRHKLILNCADEGIVGFDADGVIMFSNPAAEQLLRAGDGHLIGADVRAICASAGGQDFDTLLARVRTEGRYRADDARFACLDGREIPVDFSCAAMAEDDRAFDGCVLIFNDISQRKQVEQQLIRLARYDTLTGLANRTLFHEFLRKSMARTNRGARQMALLFIDLDHFKSINDELGHGAGDALLCGVAHRLLHVVREGDLVARLGGDEFAIILDDIEDHANAGRIAQKLLAELARPHSLEGRAIAASCSIGIAIYAGDGETPDGLIRNADAAMYQAKREGRSGYRYFSEGMSEEVSRRRQLMSDLAAAIVDGRIVPHYQPQFSAQGSLLTGFEALARWVDQGRLIAAPAQFIPLAEESGLIETLGMAIMRQACSQLRRWRDAGLVGANCRMSVNVSVQQLHSGTLVNAVQECLAEAGLAPTDLEIELTESSFVDDAAGAIEQITALSQSGVRIAIDDFGAGYSSLGYLHRMPIDSLKIDRGFITGLGQDGASEAIVESILALARSLPLTVVAEGVETQDQQAFLQRCGCDCLQGFLLGRPLSGEDMTAKLHSR